MELNGEINFDMGFYELFIVELKKFFEFQFLGENKIISKKKKIFFQNLKLKYLFLFWNNFRI
jgi:hypothetical protein